jgi:hypothetical protein
MMLWKWSVRCWAHFFRERAEMEILTKELRQAQLNKLEAQTALDYATGIVLYNDNRIARLKLRIKELEKESK